MLDIDFFKKYNDALGHGKGDECLKQVALALASSVYRANDFVARYGGEEFIAVLPNTDLHGAMDVAEQIRKSVEEMTVPCPDGLASKITVSIGVNTQSQREFCTTDEFISGADTALYDVKEKGRNGVGHAMRG